VTKTLQPPTITKPIRDIPVVFGANSTSIVPLPFPDAELANVIHDAVDVALHVHPVGAVTLMVRVPPTTFRLTGDTVRLQTAPACVTSTALSAIDTVAERGDEDGFGAMLSATMLAPVPLDVLTVIHDTGDWTVHEHPNPALIKMLLMALPPLTFTAVGDVE
jgi:hypothetical protein